MAATLGTDRIPALVDYPEGTLLLETRMRYGKVWQPSLEAVEDLERKWKLVRDANVRFIVNDDGTVNSHARYQRKKFLAKIDALKSAMVLLLGHFLS